MSPTRSVKILWITLQMVVAIINSHPESTVAHLRPYVSEFRYAPRYHPSRNPRCDLQWSRRDDSYAGRFEDRFVHRRSAYEENRPWIEIRALLVRSKMRKEVEKTPRSTRDCDKKVIISMRINNVGKTNTREKFVLVDHVLDPIKMRKIRLRNPYVVKVRQEPLLHLYGLRFQGIVNAEATEEVINNQRVNFTGCNDGLDNPICGRTLINGESISQGFCCSCEKSLEADSAAAMLRRAGSFHSTATAKSNYQRRRDGANGARGNRSESTANLFDNPKAPRQVERGNADRERADVPANGDARRVTSHDISAVNGPLGERASSRQQHRDEKEEMEQEEEEEGNNSVRQPTQRPSSSTSGGFPWVGDTLSPILRSVFFDAMRTRGKIEAYIDAVHEQAVKESAIAKFSEVNNNSSRVIVGYSAMPRGPTPFEPVGLSSRGSITESEEGPSRYEERGEDAGSRYVGDALLEDSDGDRRNLRDGESSGTRARRRRNEIAEPVDRVARQYEAYTPTMPSTPTFREITEAGTSPPAVETTDSRLTTTLATTTEITDRDFRASIRPSKYATTPFSEELHVEVSLGETILVDETEATTIGRTSVARSKRSRFIRNSLAFRHDDEERTEENRQNGRAALNGDVESPDAARPTELRFEIEKRLDGGSDYPANRKFFRRARERQGEAHEVAVRYIAARDVGLGAIDVIDERCFNSDARERARGNTRDGSTRRRKNLASSRPHYAGHDGVGKSDEDFAPAKNRADALAAAPATAELTSPTKHFSDLPRRGGGTEEEDADQHAQMDARFTAIDGIAAVMRRIAASGARNAGADDLPMIGAETPRTSDIGRARRDRANRNKNREMPSDGVNVVRGAKLTTASDKGGEEARDRAGLDGAAGGRGKKFRSSLSPFDAERRRATVAGGREDARKINGDPADVRARRVPDGGEYPRRSGEQTCGNNIREIISDIKGERSPSTSVTVNEERGSLRASAAGSGPVDWHRSVRRLLSSGKSNRVALDANDEYYEDDESEADGGSDPGDNKANADSDDLSGLGDQRDPRGYRDRRKLAVETNRSPGENIDDGGVAGEGSASDDAPVISDNARAAGEWAISGSNEGGITDASGDSEGWTHDVETVRESADPANINNNDNAPRALFEKNKVYIDRNAVDDNTPGQRQSFYDSENAPRDPRIDEVVDADSPLSSGDKISEGDPRDESLAVGQPTSTALDAKETVKYITTNHGRPITGEALRNADLSRTPASDGGIKISLSGRIRVNSVFNQTPMLISFDAVPEGRDAATTTILAGDEPLVSVGTSNPSLAAVESAAINHDERNAAAAFDLSSFIERANGAAYGSLPATSNGNRAFGETNASEVAMKFFDLARGNERQDGPTDGVRIEERLRERNNAGSRAVSKRVFLADYSSGETNRTSSRSDVAIDKLDPRSAALNFPDVLGSVLVDDDGDLVNWDATTRESQRRVGANRSVPRVVPSVRVKIAEPLVDLDANATTGAESSGHSDEDSRNATFDGCYVMPTTIRRLETTASAPRGSQTASDQPDDGEPARESTQPGVPETTTSETPPVAASRDKCDDRADAIRARNMMAIVRFVMKLLRIVAENDGPCPRARLAGGTTIHVKNVVVNGASGSENASCRRDESHVGKSHAVDDGTTITSVRTKQNFTTTTSAEWRWTIVERNRAESSPASANGTDDTFESFTEAPSDRTVTPALPIFSSDRVPENDGLFGTSARTKIYIFASSDAISTSTPRSFLFYEPGRESLRGEHAPRKDTSVHLAGVKEESRLFLNDSGKEAGGTGLRSDYYERPNRAFSDRGVVDPRLRLGEVHATNSTRKDRSVHARTISDRRARTARTKLLNSVAKGATPGEENWIGERRAAARSPVDQKLRDGTPGTVAFRRVRETIDRPRDPNLGGDGDGRSVVVEELVADDDGGPRDGKSRGRISEGIERGRSCDLVISHSASNEKQDAGENHVFQMGNRVFRKRQKAGMAKLRKRKKKEKKKERRKETKKKSSDRRTRDAWPIRSRRFKRHLLMAPLDQESTYDAGDAAAGLSRRYRIERQDAVGSPSKFAGVNARPSAAGSSAIDGSEIDAGRAQIRGGQDCAGGGHPANIDAAKYLESAHCLRFSDLWYSVYQMERPIVEHAVHLQVYEKRALANGSTYWADLTGVVRLGTFNRHRTSGEDTIAFAYKEVKTPGPQELPNLAVAHDRLLVPSSVTSKGSEYPVEGEAASEYLVVPASSINENGNECDKAGVGLAAFAGQPDRCGRVSGTCLKNQPQAYRRHDAEARAAGRPGCYFLSNFASVPREPIRYNTNGGDGSPREFLALEYHSPHVSAIDIEIRTSYNAALAGGPSGRISEVHVDGTAPDHTVVTVVMTNQRPISAYYRAAIVDCPAGLPESWVNATFPRKVIPPRRDRTVSLDLYGELPTNEFFCSVRLLNRLGSSLATRRIKIRKMDRCSCALHCSCVCVGDGAGCRPMSPELYRAAGFRGPVPATGRGILSDATLDALIFVVSLMLLLLLIGFLKWLIGLRVPAVGRWGLDSLLENGGISGYFERELRCRRVVRDEHGAPVHPDTRGRTVRICSRKAELFLNTVFFLSFPFVVCCRRLGRTFRPSARKRYSDESKISSTRDENPRTICVSTYGDNRDSRMEAEDTEYVMDELKRSEESLRNHSEIRVSYSNVNQKVSRE